MRNCLYEDDLTIDQTLALFVKDTTYGGTVIECGSCRNHMVIWQDEAGQSSNCDHCDKEILYPSWCEW